MKKFNFKKLLLSFLVIQISFLSFVNISSGYEYTIFSENKVEIINPSLINIDELNTQMANDFFTLKEKNNDLIAWINIPGVAYYPVMFTGDQKYLYADTEGKYNRAGTLFMSPLSLGNFNDTAVIYGHHMKNGTMFGGLKKYQGEDFFQQNRPITVFDGTNFYYYKPFSVFYIKDGQEDVAEKGLLGDERLAYFQKMYDRSIVKMENGLYPDLDAQMLMLQTCEYFSTDARQVVAMYLLKTISY